MMYEQASLTCSPSLKLVCIVNYLLKLADLYAFPPAHYRLALYTLCHAKRCSPFHITFILITSVLMFFYV